MKTAGVAVAVPLIALLLGAVYAARAAAATQTPAQREAFRRRLGL